MRHARRVVLSVVMLGFAACGAGTSGGDAGRDAAKDTNDVTGTFSESGSSPCLTNIEGFSNDPSLDDPQCTVVEHPGDGGSPVTFGGACIDTNLQPPCWGWTSCAGGLGFTFLLSTVTTPPPGATFSYQCTAR